MWVSHDDFLKVVERSWNEPFSSGDDLFTLAGKLKRLKVALRTWNKDVFGKVEENIRALKERVEVLDVELQNKYSREIEYDFLEARDELD